MRSYSCWSPVCCYYEHFCMFSEGCCVYNRLNIYVQCKTGLSQWWTHQELTGPLSTSAFFCRVFVAHHFHYLTDQEAAIYLCIYFTKTLINQLYSCQKHVSDSAPTSSHQHTSPALAVVLLMLTPKIYLVLPTENTSSKLNPDDFLQIVVPLSLWHGTFVLCHVLLHLAVTQIAKQMGSWEDQAWFK